MTGQITDHAYSGQPGPSNSCQYIYTDPRGGICARMDGEHGPVPAAQPGTGELAAYVATHVPPGATYAILGDRHRQITVAAPEEDAEARQAEVAAVNLAAAEQARTVNEGPGGMYAAGHQFTGVSGPGQPCWYQPSEQILRGEAGPTCERPYEDHPPPPPRCTHGGDCPVHPDAQGLHDRTPTAAEALDAVMAAVLIRPTFGAEDVRGIAARLGVELRR